MTSDRQTDRQMPDRADLESLTPAQRRELLAELLRDRLATPHLSFAQERLWFLQQLAPDTSVYNVPAAVELTGDLDVAALESSLARIVRRHEVLRTVFERGSEGPVPRIVDHELELEREDLSKEPVEDRRARALERANEMAREPFDPERGPLIRARLLRFGARQQLLVVVAHHLVAEVWSLAVMFEELERLYAAAVAGEPARLDPLPMQYSDYACWQRQHFRGDVLGREVDYWKRRLEGELPVLELPTDGPRPAVQTFAGGWRQRRLEPELGKGLERLSRDHGTTLFMTLLAAFQTLLCRYTGETDILVGSPVAARSRREAERLVGLFLNTVVLRTDLGGDPTFAQLLERVRHVAVGALSHQEVPFEQVVEKVAPDRRLSHTPIFQVMFALQNTPRPELDLAGLEPGQMLGPDEIHNAGTKVDLALFVESVEESLLLGCEYSSDLFAAETIDRILEHLEVLLQASVDDPDRRLSRLPLMPAAERHRVLVEWNRTDECTADAPVHELVARHAATEPDAVAVVRGDVALTYGELDRRANRLARFLGRQGPVRGRCVGLLADPTTDAIVAQLAILKAGGAYLSIDPSYPTERIGFLLRDSTVAAVLTREQERSRVAALTDAPIVGLDASGEPWSEEDTAPLRATVELDDAAYVIYTSGSTGQPKGVEVPHRGLANLAAWHRVTYELGQGDRSTQLASLAFDASVWEIWSILTAGGRLYVLDEETRLSPDAILTFLDEHRIRTAFVPTPMAEVLLEREWPSGMALEHLLTGGSRLHRHAPRDRPFQLVNHYGPTENSVVTTATPIGHGEADAGLPPIGRPISGHRVYILDRHLQPVPIGVPGEIWVGGVGLANGYRSRPELTAERFLPDPFGTTPGGRLYRTGDTGRWRADGQIDFLGRQDHQVQVRGFRVEPEEIEAALLEHPEIREAAVVYELENARHGVLTAYFASRAPAALPARDLRRFLRRRLPEHMIPGVFVELPELPLTASGKVDHRALRRAPRRERTSPAPHVLPLKPLEETILSVWQEVLPTTSIGLDDSFFELGGHSLMLVEVHNRLRETLDSELSIVDLFRYPTINSLVAHCERTTAVPR